MPGARRFVYSVVWSNEDGGTNSSGLMARWGRTTDIEWIYAVDVDSNGDRIPGSGSFHGHNHQRLPFTGEYEDDHPILLRQEGRAGHGVGKPLHLQADELADVLTFFSWQLGGPK